MAFEDYSPLWQGDTGKPFAPTFQYIDPLSGLPTPLNLTGMSFSMRMQGEDGTIKVCGGTWTIDDAVNGKAHYSWQAADVNTPGMWTLQIAITNGSGQVMHSDMKNLLIKATI